MLGGLADVERGLIRTRTAEGRSWAQKRGQRMGRKSKLSEALQAEARKRRAELDIPPVAVQRTTVNQNQETAPGCGPMRTNNNAALKLRPVPPPGNPEPRERQTGAMAAFIVCTLTGFLVGLIVGVLACHLFS